MANRSVYGNTVSENGWPMVDEGSCNWVSIPGCDVTIEIQQGQPTAVLRAFVADINANVQPVRDGDTACWTPTNSVATSNHLSGTAVDIDWDDHPMGPSYAGWSGDQISEIRAILDYYESTVFWGQDWTTPKDSMHFQMGYDTFGSPATQDFIARKIRADGYSTYQRGNAPVTPPPPVLSRADGYAVKIIQEGQRRGITPRGIEIALATGLVESNLTIYANEAVPASMAIPHDAVGSDAYSVGIFQQQVRDTGNGWWWGDAATCMDPTLSAGLFYDRLADLDYNGPNSPGSYAQAVQDSAFPDRYDQRFADAVAIYNRLASTGDDDDMFTDDDRNLLQQVSGIFRQSLSPLRHPGEGAVNTCAGFAWSADGLIHPQFVAWAAKYGHTDSLTLLGQVAGDTDPARAADTALAKAILADIEATNPAVLQAFLNGAHS